MAIDMFNVLEILYYLGLLLVPVLLGTNKILQSKASQKAGKHYSKIGFCNCSAS